MESAALKWGPEINDMPQTSTCSLTYEAQIAREQPVLRGSPVHRLADETGQEPSCTQQLLPDLLQAVPFLQQPLCLWGLASSLLRLQGLDRPLKLPDLVLISLAMQLQLSLLSTAKQQESPSHVCFRSRSLKPSHHHGRPLFGMGSWGRGCAESERQN